MLKAILTCDASMARQCLQSPQLLARLNQPVHVGNSQATFLTRALYQLDEPNTTRTHEGVTEVQWTTEAHAWKNQPEQLSASTPKHAFVQVLIDARADVNAPCLMCSGRIDSTPLMHAMRMFDMPLVELLIAARADPGIETVHGTALASTSPTFQYRISARNVYAVSTCCSSLLGIWLELIDRLFLIVEIVGKRAEEAFDKRYSRTGYFVRDGRANHACPHKRAANAASQDSHRQ
jgi:hypothetical protein